MSLDVSELEPAEWSEFSVVGRTVRKVWTGEAHGVTVTYETTDFDAEYWVSPIWNMRQKGVALVDSSGRMVKCERRNR